MATNYVTTGLFPVPNLPAAVGATVTIFLSSFQDEAVTVAWAVNRAGQDGRKERIRDGTVEVPGQGMSQVTLLPGEVEGRVIEVNLNLPTRTVRSSLGIINAFLADESRQLSLWLSPRDFALRRTARFGHAKPWRVRSRRR